MHIVVIEDDFFEREILVKNLKKTFPNFTITEFRNVGDFLLAISVLPSADIIITEHFLPLGETKPDFEKWIENLYILFPAVTTNWNYQEAGVRLVRHLRQNTIDIPVIIYTHSDKDWIDADVLKDPKVFYCKKCGENNKVIPVVKRLLSVSV